ncbi:MAG: hypothetical protein LQ338_007695 [Usnochroma carphineum]|nr:MAG: hypothetical protein LQ338_007695 [Usnochroma carphineum]
MATFSPISFPYEAEDKELEYPTQILEEPFSDLFDQYLTQTISDPGGHAYDASGAELPDRFTDGDTTSSASCATDSTSTAPLQLRFGILQDRSRQGNASCLSKTAFVPQNYHTRGRREKLLPAVSGLELLLDVEGKANTTSQNPNPPHSAPATLTSLPLRRKPRFSTCKSKDLHDRNHRVSKSSIHLTKEAPNMTMPLFDYPLEPLHPEEWAHGLEQLSLQAPANPFPLSLPTTGMPQYYDKTSPGIQSPRHLTLREKFLQGDKNSEQGTHNIPHDLDSSMDATADVLDPRLQQSKEEEHSAVFDGSLDYIESTHLEPGTVQRRPYHSASWEPSVSSRSDVTYTLANGQPASNWSPGVSDSTNSYYSHNHAAKSAPALPYQLSTETSLEYLTATTEPSDALNYKATFDNGIIQPLESFVFDPEPHQYPPPPTPDSHHVPAQERSCRPDRRTSSSIAAQMPLAHNRQRSKSAQRRKSAGNLKSPKSPATMGFVNFTPNDSQRILTGVAPSGSSKTKARREQEANEKKRKLSLAVLRAVEEAGGDPEPLRKEGLLIYG